MVPSFSRTLLHWGALILLLAGALSPARGAEDSSRIPIEVLPGTGRLLYIETDSGAINKLIGEVAMKQGETLLYCDSAYFDLQRNQVEAFGNVEIIQPGSRSVSDYLLYLGDRKMAYMNGEVMLTDGQATLWSDQVTYNMNSRLGWYEEGGRLVNDQTTVTSRRGQYNMATKEARFTEDVVVVDPDYHIESLDLGYHTETEFMVFHDSSVVTTDSSRLTAWKGTYDTRAGIAHFTRRSAIWNGSQYMESDTLDFDRGSGIGLARGRVLAWDTVQRSTLFAGRADYDRDQRQLLASLNPVLVQENGGDSLFISADTFFMAPRHYFFPPDSLGLDSGGAVRVDSSQDDRLIIGYHGVRLYSDSLQGSCDSISYDQRDSVLRMIVDPVLWSNQSQITGDTILLYMTDSQRIRELFVPSRALMVSVAGPAGAGIYDQVQGQQLRGFFTHNQLRVIHVEPEAQCIYYAQDEDGAFLGVNQVSSERMRIQLNDDQRIRRIRFEQQVDHRLSPLDQVDLDEMKLPRFHWREEQRPLAPPTGYWRREPGNYP